MGPDSPAHKREEPVVPLINPDTGSEIEVESNGDYTVTFSMTLPQTPADDTDES